MSRFLFSFFVFVVISPSLSASELLKRWKSDPDDTGFAVIEITKSDDIFAGKIVELSEPLFPKGDKMAGMTKIDRKNPNKNLRGRPIIGIEILQGFKADGDKKWGGGTIYDPKSGKTYQCKMHIDDEGNLQIRGFIGISLFGRTTIWKPADS